jgi:hypothetical protein
VSVDRVRVLRARDAIKAYSVYVLSESDDEEHTLRLNAPIRHITTGPRTGFVQRQRYVSEGAVSKEPATTRELLELDGG